MAKTPTKKKHNPAKNLGAFHHPKGSGKPKAKAAPKTARTHLDKPSKPATAKVVTGPKAPRADFALSGGLFPLNTAGRRQVADKDAAIARKAGTISAAEQAKVKRAVSARKKTT